MESNRIAIHYYGTYFYYYWWWEWWWPDQFDYFQYYHSIAGENTATENTTKFRGKIDGT